MKVAELLSDASRWTQGVYARNKDGVPVDARDADACSWCLTGAIDKCYPYSEGKRMRDRLRLLIGGSIIDYNDTRTYEEVLSVVRKAGI